MIDSVSSGVDGPKADVEPPNIHNQNEYIKNTCKQKNTKSIIYILLILNNHPSPTATGDSDNEV